MSTERTKRHRRSTAGATVVALLATAGIGLAAPQASADSVSVGYTCTGAGAPSGVNPIQVTLNAPATIAQGGTANLTLSATTQMTAPVDLPAGAVTAEADIVLGGANSGTATATGFTNDSAVPSGSTVSVSGGTASIQLNDVGTTTYTPGAIAVHVFGLTVNCTVADTAPVLGSTEVTAS
ncbi:hypothetical protein [Streptomyces sp. GS7]|uniref:hypothetical protein n=1 Tax=Streptomyces sp. GS7 TaxID=2692234 RepID=UPI001319B700|nr:hypothetical protein [Streptomyces sp. GS7]QHC23968.1 hypothetical protein GR130_23945 [Streptomyces sp. GS7]